eukprot:TRINITY_DN6746_c0_g1_i5.p1 TRINITY_DN6746_c0_g1~~TRINITY_DN6746_c0_g1_i5.p1  ORF type:complete len:230 (+),score=69.36 TRINITY_DN6746_c0_g1_i5:513-1202(+)
MAFLESVVLLQNLSPENLHALVDVMQVQFFQTGDLIIKKGDPGDAFYILEEGHAYASHAGKAVQEYGPGSYFGELALLKRQLRATDVVADASQTKVLVLDRRSFTRLLGPLGSSFEQRAKDYVPLHEDGQPGGGGGGKSPKAASSSKRSLQSKREEWQAKREERYHPQRPRSNTEPSVPIEGEDDATVRDRAETTGAQGRSASKPDRKGSEPLPKAASRRLLSAFDKLQ